MGCSVGAGLIGFYQLHLLSFISYEFFIIPLVLLGKQGYQEIRIEIFYLRIAQRIKLMIAIFFWDGAG